MVLVRETQTVVGGGDMDSCKMRRKELEFAISEKPLQFKAPNLFTVAGVYLAGRRWFIEKCPL